MRFSGIVLALLVAGCTETSTPETLLPEQSVEVVPAIPVGDFTTAPDQIPENFVPSAGDLQSSAARFYSVATETSRLRFLNYIKRTAELPAPDRINLVRGFLTHPELQPDLFDRVDQMKQDSRDVEDFKGVGRLVLLPKVTKDSLARLNEVFSVPPESKADVYQSFIDAEEAVQDADLDSGPSSPSTPGGDGKGGTYFWIPRAAAALKSPEKVKKFLSIAASSGRELMKILSYSVPSMTSPEQSEMLNLAEEVDQLIADKVCKNAMEDCRSEPELFRLVKYVELRGTPVPATDVSQALSTLKKIRAKADERSADAESSLNSVPDPLVTDEASTIYATEQDFIELDLREHTASFLGRGGEFSLDCSNSSADAVVDGRVGTIRSSPTSACDEGITLSAGGALSIQYGFDAVSADEIVSSLVLPIVFTQQDKTSQIPVTIVISHVDRPLEASILPSFSGNEGESIQGLITAVDPDEDRLFYTCVSGCRADSLSLNSSTGSFVYTPTFADAGVHQLRFRVTAEGGSSVKEVSTEVTVFNVNRPPVIFPADSLNLTEGESGSIQVISHDPDGDEVTFACEDCSSILLTATGKLLYTPSLSTITGSAAEQKKITATVSVSDGEFSASEVFSFLVTNKNQAPVLGEVADASVVEGDLLEINLSAVDPDGPNSSLRYTCHAGCPTENYELDEAGVFRWTPSFFSDGVYTITFRAVDGDLHSDSLATVTVLNKIRPPEPFAAFISAEQVSLGESLSCSGSTTDIDGERLRYSFEWVTVDGDIVTSIPDAGSSELLVDTSLAHARVACRMTADDGRGGTTESTLSQAAEVLNSEPLSFASKTKAPSRVVGSVVECLGDTSDPDGDELTYTTRWYRGSADSLEAIGDESLLTITSDHAHSLLSCIRSASDPFDGSVDGDRSDEILVLNTPPSSFTSALDKQTAAPGDTVLCQGETTDVDGDDLVYSYEWTRLGDPSEVIESAVSSSYQIQPKIDARASIVCRVIADDQQGGIRHGEVSSAVSVTNLPPDPFEPEVVGVALVNSVLECLAETTDPDGDEIQTNYQWFRGSEESEDADLERIDGASDSLYTVRAADAHRTLACVVVASDDFGGEREGSVRISIENSPPSQVAVDASALAIGLSDDLVSSTVCSASAEDVDGDDLVYSYEWVIDHDAIPDAEREVISHESELRAEDFPFHARTEVVVCRVTVSDGTAETAADGPSVTYQNSPPVVVQVSATPSARVGDSVTCEAVVTDLDGDETTATYTWHHEGDDGLGDPFYEGAVMVVSSISAHSSVVCRAVASDGLNQSDPVASEPTLILNSDPVIISAPADITVDEGQTFAATIRVDDVDTDAVTASCINCPAGSTFLPKSIDVDGVFESAYEFSYAPSFDVVTATQQTVSNTVTIRLEDPYGGVYSHVIPVTVSHVDREPEVILSCPSQKDEGTTMGLFIDITDPDDDSIAVTYLSGIPGTSVAPLSAVGVITQSIPVDVSFDAVGRPRPSSGSEDFVIELLVKSGQYEQIHACSVTIKDIDRPAVLLDPCPPQQWAETETVTWEPRLVDPDYASPITAEFSITNSWSFAGQTGTNPAPTILPTGVHQYEGSHDLIPHTGPRFTQDPIYTYPQTTGGEIWMQSVGDFGGSSYMTKYEQSAVAYGAKDTFRAYTLLYHNYDIESYTQKNYYRDVTARVTSQSPDEDSLIEKTCSYRITDVDRPPVIEAPPTEITPSSLYMETSYYTQRRYVAKFNYASILFGSNSRRPSVNPANLKNSQPWASGITASDPDGDRVSLEQSWFEARNIFLSEWKNGGSWELPYYNRDEGMNTTINGTYEYRDVRHEIVLGIHAYSNGTRLEFEKTLFKEGKIEIEPPDNDPYYYKWDYDWDYGTSHSLSIKSPLGGHMYLIKFRYDSDYVYPGFTKYRRQSDYDRYSDYCSQVGLGTGSTCWRRYVETLTVPEHPRGPLPICYDYCEVRNWGSGSYYSSWEYY